MQYDDDDTTHGEYSVTYSSDDVNGAMLWLLETVERWLGDVEFTNVKLVENHTLRFSIVRLDCGR
jgi:hypothetical protein